MNISVLVPIGWGKVSTNKEIGWFTGIRIKVLEILIAQIGDVGIFEMYVIQIIKF